jgi:hypothetical protein
VWFRILSPFAGDPRRIERTVSLLSRLVAGSLGLLVAVTWPLWVPTGDFPRVPFLGWVTVPAWVEWTALGAFGAATIASLILGAQRPANRWSVTVGVAALGLLVLADQHRLQPWVYQLVVLSLVLAWLSPNESISLARLLVVSIYFFSALSKLDRSFFNAGGGQIVDGLMRCCGLNEHLGAHGRTALAGLFATAELLLSAGLCWRRSRRFAWPALIAMHVLLLAALGPWGAQSKPGVLLWNVYLIVQNFVLFGLAGEAEFSPAPVASRGPAAQWIIRGLAAFVMLFPLTEPFGVCDVWPAWAVYATGPVRLRLFVEAGQRERLPSEIRAYVQTPRYEDDLCLVRIDRWSLDTCQAPLYPQNRFRLGVALAFADNAGPGDNIVVELDSAAARFTGERTTRQLKGRSAIAAELERYWLNGFPRERGN